MWRQIPVVSLLLAFSHVSFVSATGNCDVNTFAKYLPASSKATVKSATKVASNGTYGGGGFATDPDFPGNATDLPALCAVAYTVGASDGTTHYSFGMYLPDNWNNRMMGVGNTGFGGGIDWTEMGPLVQYGFATISTDTGHLSGPNDAKWANSAPNALRNWGYEALHTSVVLGKQVINGHYGTNASYSYFSACSGGGRQGLKDLQMFPDDFDGVVAGAAPWLLSHLHPWAVKVAMPNLAADPKDNVTDGHFDAFNAEVLRQCDPQDGHTDGVVSDPYGCNFNYDLLRCNSTFTNTSVCFSDNQVNIIKETYADWVENGNFIYPSYSLASNAGGLAGSGHGGDPSTFGTVYVENFVMNNTNWNWKTLNASTVAIADSLDPGNSNADLFDLTAYKNAGHKLITYHGMADTLIPTATSIYYYEQVLGAMGGTLPRNNKDAGNDALNDFYRMFLVPDMHHCSGSSGHAPWYFGGAGQVPPDNGSTYSVDGFMDRQHDIIYAIMTWVENGTAPDSITATSWHNNDATKGVKFQRPICPYPQQAKYLGHGSDSDPSNWACSNGTMVGFGQLDIVQAGSQNPAVPVSTTSSKAIAGGMQAASVGAWAAAILGWAYLL